MRRASALNEYVESQPTYAAPAVVPPIPEREQTVGHDFAIASLDDAVAHREVVVLDDNVALSAAPDRVPRAQIVAAEQSFDARMTKWPGHLAVEAAAAAERDAARL